MFKDSADDGGPDAKRLGLVFLILAVAGGGVVYRITVFGRLDQTAVLFIGMPALIALIVALTPKAKSATGSRVESITTISRQPGYYHGWPTLASRREFFGIELSQGVLAMPRRSGSESAWIL